MEREDAGMWQYFITATTRALMDIQIICLLHAGGLWLITGRIFYAVLCTGR